VSITLWQPAAAGRRDVALPAGHALGTAAPQALDARYGDEALQLMLRNCRRLGVAAASARPRSSAAARCSRSAWPAAAVGRRNGEAARDLLLQHGIRGVSESLFGEGHRQIVFDVAPVMSGAPGQSGTGMRAAGGDESIKVMVVDDSAVVRQVVTGLLDAAPGIEVIAAVADPLLAIER
jgi:hypothetical protein